MKLEKVTIVLLMLLGIALVTGCTGKPTSEVPPVYTPKVDFELSTYTINVNDNSFSKDIKITVIKRDNENKPTDFVLMFKSSNPDYVYPVDAESNTTVYQKPTGTLTAEGREFTYQFKIFGKKVAGQPQSPFEINIDLLYNNGTLIPHTLKVTVI